MSIPSENVAMIGPIGGSSLYYDSPCRSEPLVIHRLSGTLSITSLGSEGAEILAADGVGLRFFRLVEIFENATHPFNTSRLSLIETDGIDVEGGLRIVEDRGGSGRWSFVRLPLSYRDTRGEPVVMSRDLFGGGGVIYPLGPTLSLEYEILNFTNQPITPQWVEIDRAVRSELLSWIED